MEQFVASANFQGRYRYFVLGLG